MQPLKLLSITLESIASSERYLFTLNDIRCLFSNHTSVAFRALLWRAEKDGLLRRVCRGVYLYCKTDYPKGTLLYHTVTKLRASSFNYLSLESELSNTGIISQIPMNWITVMSSGRKSIVKCGDFGTIEFIHTKKSPNDLKNSLFYDQQFGMWRASPALALRDLKRVGRNLELVNEEVLKEELNDVI